MFGFQDLDPHRGVRGMRIPPMWAGKGRLRPRKRLSTLAKSQSCQLERHLKLLRQCQFRWSICFVTCVCWNVFVVMTLQLCLTLLFFACRRVSPSHITAAPVGYHGHGSPIIGPIVYTSMDMDIRWTVHRWFMLLSSILEYYVRTSFVC